MSWRNHGREEAECRVAPMEDEVDEDEVARPTREECIRYRDRTIVGVAGINKPALNSSVLSGMLAPPEP